MNEILSHADIPETKRDLKWEKTFLKLLSQAKLTLLSDSAQEGPDSFPYLLAETRADSTEPATNLLSWLAAKGIGLVVNPQKPYPDYILTWGMIWNFKERGEFLTDAPIQAANTIQIESGEKILAGAPHPQYLPDYVRGILRQFLLDSGVMVPRILVVGTKDNQFDLCFSLESLGNPPAHEHEGILKALSWFLPPHYSMALMSEKGLPPFVNL